MAVAGGVSISSAAPLLRKGVPGERKPLKEKLLTYYELIFEVSCIYSDRRCVVYELSYRAVIHLDKIPSSGMSSFF